jgi:predicted SPOUT superfamily RNA methylase MTH1
MKRNIAAQCPYQYGSAVYQARLLLSFVDSVEYSNVCENSYVNTGNLKIVAENQENNNDNITFTVFPNPANDVLTVLKTSESIAIIEIYNYIGNKIMSKVLKENSSIISISDLSTGVYLYKIIINNEVIKTDKVIVIK